MGGYFVPDTNSFLIQGNLSPNENKFFTVPPAYPGLLDLIQIVIKNHENRFFVLVLFQHLLNLLSIFLVTYALFIRYGKRASTIGGILYAILPVSYFFAQTSQTESLYLSLSGLALGCWILSNSKNKLACYSLALLCGVFVGLSTGIRMIGIYFIPLCLLLLALILVSHNQKKIAGVKVCMALSGFFIIHLAWLSFNHKIRGIDELNQTTGIHLYNRICLESEEYKLVNSSELELIQTASSHIGQNNIRYLNAGWTMHYALEKAIQDETIKTDLTPDAILKAASIPNFIKRPLWLIKSTWTVLKYTAIDQPSHQALLWMPLNKKGWIGHNEMGALFWDKETIEYTNKVLPPHEAIFQNSLVQKFIYVWSSFSRIFKGYIGYLLLAVGLVLSTFKGNITTTFCFLFCAGNLAISVLFEAAQPRFWSICFPFLLVAWFLLLVETKNLFSNKTLKLVGIASGTLIASLFALNLFQYDFKELSQEAESRRRVQKLSLAFVKYAQDNNDEFPMGEDWKKDLLPYIEDTEDSTVWYHPMSDELNKTNTDSYYGAYAYNKLLAEGFIENNGKRRPWKYSEIQNKDRTIILATSSYNEQIGSLIDLSNLDHIKPHITASRPGKIGKEGYSIVLLANRIGDRFNTKANRVTAY